MGDVLATLFATIEARKREMPAGSYTTQLLQAGQPEICKKVGEEAVEVVVAALAQDDERVLSEMADLIYHNFVLLAARGLTVEALEAELQRRF